MGRILETTFCVLLICLVIVVFIACFVAFGSMAYSEVHNLLKCGDVWCP